LPPIWADVSLCWFFPQADGDETIADFAAQDFPGGRMDSPETAPKPAAQALTLKGAAWVVLWILGYVMKLTTYGLALCVPLFALMFTVGYLGHVTGIENHVQSIVFYAPFAALALSPIGFAGARRLCKKGPSRAATVLAYLSAALAALSLPALAGGPMIAFITLAQPYLSENTIVDLGSHGLQESLLVLGSFIVIKPFRWSLRKPPLIGGHGAAPAETNPD
jgi:hypothetical protein